MNDNLKKYLEYYIDLEASPGFAVMINGGWGSGKTWFMNKLESYVPLDELTVFRISLYGKSLTEHIDDDIYKEMNPILSSKGMVVAGSLAKAFLRGTIRLDLDGDNKAETNLSFGVPDINLKKLQSNPEKIIIIFDDFERCNINIIDLFGYINSLTEVHGCKVIILCNEKIFSEDEKNEAKTYHDAKEKVVGATFKYNADINGAIDDFIKEIGNERLSKHIENNIQPIKEIIAASECENLRFLKRFFMDFERLYLSLKDEHKANNKLVVNLLFVNFILKYESKSNNVNIKDFSDGKTLKSGAGISYETTRKYNYNPLSHSVLSLETWGRICQDNILDKDVITNEVQNSLISTERKTEAWIKLWDYSTLSEDEFEASLKEIEEKLTKHSYDNENIVKHLFGTIISLEENGVITKKDVKKLKDLCRNEIRHLASKGNLEYIDTIYNAAFINESWAGLSFNSRDHDEFLNFANFIENKRLAHEQSQYPDVVKTILQSVSDNNMDYRNIMNPNIFNAKNYFNKPIFSTADAQDIASVISKSQQLRNFCMALNSRYTKNGAAKALLTETAFLQDLIVELQTIKDRTAHRLSKHKINDSVDYFLNPALTFLNAVAEGKETDIH